MLAPTCLLALVAAATAQSGCRAFGGDGAATLRGAGTLVVPPNMTTATNADLAVGMSGPAASQPFAAILIGPFSDAAPSPATSHAGWIVSGNATGQTLHFWYPGVCETTSVAYPQFFAPAFSFGGGNATTFPFWSRTFVYGAEDIQLYVQDAHDGATEARFVGATCVPTSIRGEMVPFGTGAWAVVFEEGAAVAPPATWGVPPAACQKA